MKYQVIRNEKYDFIGQSYATSYPNLHKYPATMLPQIGVEILRELNITKGTLLDPYCGSGSSFAAGLECGITQMKGFDINPLAILISSVKFTNIHLDTILATKATLRNHIFEFIKNEQNIEKLPLPRVTNIDFWFSKNVYQNLNVVRYFINQIEDEKLRNFFLLPFSETVRDCSFTRNNEFKLYKMKPEDVLNFNPDVIGVYFKKLTNMIDIYGYIYLPKLTKQVCVEVEYAKFEPTECLFDVVLTSPPYGDSRTTVAYGQFSTLSNEWAGIEYARKIDSMLMGGNTANYLYNNGLMTDYVLAIHDDNPKRALEVSSFYIDLANSIKKVASGVKKGGKIIYVVGNRTVKNIHLPTDQFIAEKFEENGFQHLITYERALTNKAMPSKNSPSNKTGATKSTMLYEYIIVCEKQ